MKEEPFSSSFHVCSDILQIQFYSWGNRFNFKVLCIFSTVGQYLFSYSASPVWDIKVPPPLLKSKNSHEYSKCLCLCLSTGANVHKFTVTCLVI